MKIIAYCVLVLLMSCSGKNSSDDQRKSIEMVTTKGTIVLDLYNETPLHRDNFIKLAKEAAFDSLLFHRVIQNFMIQAGDPDSKYAQPGDTLGNGDRKYTVPAEFRQNLFHKKGVLAAARDGNPERASSAMQFYIVQGRIFNDSTLDRAEKRINGWLAQHYSYKDPANKSLVDELKAAEDNKDNERSKMLRDSLRNIAKSFTDFAHYIIPDDQREVYKTIGGTPHLDQNYTVFGEVTSGLAVVDSIAAVKTNSLDRPLEDVRILSVRVMN
ncbi:MAG: peptidylprolyl isomerase [Calditrichaeota bacterium]|nr:peptidylprolyl isomerase [Calditrichota bacterium]